MLGQVQDVFISTAAAMAHEAAVWPHTCVFDAQYSGCFPVAHSYRVSGVVLRQARHVCHMYCCSSAAVGSAVRCCRVVGVMKTMMKTTAQEDQRGHMACR